MGTAKQYKCLNCGTEVDTHISGQKCPTCGATEFKESVPSKRPTSPTARPKELRTREVRTAETMKSTAKTSGVTEARSRSSKSSISLNDFLRGILRIWSSWPAYSIWGGALVFLLWYGALNKAFFQRSSAGTRYLAYAAELKAGNLMQIPFLVVVLGIYYLPMASYFSFANKSAWKYKYTNKKVLLIYFGGATLFAAIIKILELPLDTSVMAASLLALVAHAVSYSRKKTWERKYAKRFDLGTLAFMIFNYIFFSRWFLYVTLEALAYLLVSLNKII